MFHFGGISRARSLKIFFNHGEIIHTSPSKSFNLELISELKISKFTSAMVKLFSLVHENPSLHFGDIRNKYSKISSTRVKYSLSSIKIFHSGGNLWLQISHFSLTMVKSHLGKFQRNYILTMIKSY